jgi:hypothetical protein
MGRVLSLFFNFIHYSVLGVFIMGASGASPFSLSPGRKTRHHSGVFFFSVYFHDHDHTHLTPWSGTQHVAARPVPVFFFIPLDNLFNSSLPMLIVQIED